MSSASSRLKDVDRTLHQLNDFASVKDVDVDKDTIESVVLALFRRATRCVAESRVAAELCCSRLFHGKQKGSALTLLDIMQFQDMGSGKTFGTLLSLLLDHLLSFLRDLHDPLKHAISGHVERIVNVSCTILATNTLSSKCRSTAGELAKYVVKNYSPPSTSIQVHSLVDRLMNELKSSKTTQTVKGVILEFLGVILRKYPEETSSCREVVRQWIETALEKQFSSNSPGNGLPIPTASNILDKDMQIISGSFLCLTEILVGETYDKDKRDTLFTWIHMTLATSMAGNLSRLAIVKSCLVLLGKHMHMFSENIQSGDPYQFYSLILHCCSSSNKKIRKPAFACLDSVFEIIAEGLVVDVAQNKKHFNRFLKDFLSCLTEKLSDDKASISLAGLGNFASIIPAFMGVEALPKIHARLVKYGEDIMAMRDGLRFKWLLLCRYTTCYGRFVQKLQSPNTSVQNFAVSLVCRILDTYPTSAIYIKVQAELALLSIWSAFPDAETMRRIMQHGMLLTISTQVNPSPTEILYHPDTGLPDTRFLYEYEILWRNCLQRLKGTPLGKLMVDVMMETILDILGRLDLRYRLKAEKTAQDTSEYEPLVRRDQTIALNMTEFCERWLKSVNHLFQPWIPRFIKWILTNSKELPLISAFYRLATVISDSLTIELSITKSLCDEYVEFVLDVSTAMKQYRDELLITTSLFVLATPAQLVNFSSLVPALKQALILGVSHHDTAVAALSTLKKWRQVQPDVIVPFYPALLPLFAPYLNDANEGTIFQVQVLRFLGRLGGHCRFVVEDREPDVHNSAPLDFTLTLDRVHANISLEDLLHQTMELALASIDRAVKSSACEAYHAMILYLCGKTATLPRSQNNASEKSVYYSHWEAIFPSLLKLAADSDTITRSLFDPLLSQLVRWFSGISSIYPFEAQNFLDTLIHGLSSVDNGGIRDLSAKSLATFLKYAGKQPASSLFSAHSLFERLFALCCHPSITYRLGVALAIEHMYRDFREDQNMVDVYVLTITKHLLLALKTEKSNSLAPLQLALDHMEKIIMKCASILQAENTLRIELGGPECLSLESFTTWLFSNIASSTPTFRKRCLSLFVSLSRMVGLTGSCKEWLKKYLKSHSMVELLDIFAPRELITFCFQAGMKSVWYDTLAASIECYVWACTPALGNQSLIADSILFDNTQQRKRGLDPTEQLHGSHRVLAAATTFLSSNDRPSPSRNRAFEGICRLITVALEHASLVPVLHNQILQSCLLSDEFLRLVVLARIDPKEVNLLEMADTSTWVNLCREFLKCPQLTFANTLNKYIITSPSYAYSNLFSMNVDLAARICSVYYELNQIKYWPSAQQQQIAQEFAALAIDMKRTTTLTPLQDEIARSAMQTALELGWKLVNFILQDTTENYLLFKPTFDSALLDQSIWFEVVSGLMLHIQRHPNFVHILHTILQENVKPTDSLAPFVVEFANFALSSENSEQSLVVGTLHQILCNFKCDVSLNLSDCANRVKSLLMDAFKSASLKTEVMQCIPDLLHFSSQYTQPLVEGISHLIVHDFPLKSSDVPKDTLAFETFELLFRSFLMVVVKSGHVEFLKTLFQSFKEKKEHIFYFDIQEALGSFCFEMPSTRVLDSCKQILSMLFDFMLEEYTRTILLRQVFVPLVNRLNESETVKLYSTEIFGTSVIQYLMTIVTNDTSSTISITLAFGALEVLYECLSGDAIRQLINPVFAPAPAKGNELTMRLCKTASQKISSPDQQSAVAAYRCLLVTVRKTQTQEKFYTQLLFADSIWPKIMDETRTYSFETQTNSFSKSFLSNSNKKSKWKHSFKNIGISTQFLEGSSLSQSVSSTSAVDLETAIIESEDDETLEMDILNMHPCMIPLMQTIKTMEILFEGQWTASQMPGWIEKLWFNLTTNTSSSVRLFLCKVVLNRPALFKSYSAKFVAPLVDLMLNVPKIDEFHYILRDVCHLLLDTWDVETVDTDLSQFVNRLITVSPNTSTAILRDNLYIIESFLSRYPSQCRFIDMDAIVHMINTFGEGKEETSKHVSGMQITAVLLNMAFISPQPVNSYEYLIRNCCSRLEMALLSRMTSTHKTTPQLAADIAGILLKFIHSTTFQSSIEMQLKSYFQESKPDRFLLCLKQVMANFPAMLDESMLNRLMSILPRIWIQDSLSLCTLDILYLSSLPEAELFRCVRHHLPRLLRHNNTEVPLRLLDLVIKLWPGLPDENKTALLTGESSVILAFESELCHMKVLDFLITTNRLDIPSVHKSLLQGLTDANIQVRDKCFEFWETRLPGSCDQRLLELFSTMYHQQTTEEWVRYAPRMWLALCSSSVENAQLLFNNALSSTASFEHMQIDTAWERRTQTVLTPMFSQDAQALQSQPIQLYEAGVIKATQDPVWSQTQSQHFSSTQESTTALRTSQGTKNTRFSKSIDASLDESEDRTKTFFQDRASRAKRFELAKLQQEKHKGTSVSLFREYRVGEFPDIQIPRMDIIRPLVALASSHAGTASLLFSSLLSAILPTLPASTQLQVFTQIENLLEQSQQNSFFVSSLHQAYLTLLRHPSTLMLAPDVIGATTISSRNFVSGQRILEEILIRATDDAILLQAWNQLHHVLQMVHNEPYLIAVSSQNCTVPETSLALEAQLKGDIVAALKLYKDTEDKYETMDGAISVSVTERQRWKSEQYQCLEILNKWDVLLEDVQTLNLWQQKEPFLEKHMEYFLEASISQNEKEVLKSVLSECQQDNDKEKYILSRFPDLMCCINLQSQLFNETQAVVEHFYTTCLNQWNSMPVAHQYRQLERLPNIVYLEEIARSVKSQDYDLSTIMKWQPILPSLQEDNLKTWSSYNLIRNLGLDVFVTTMGNVHRLDDMTQRDIAAIRVHTKLSYAEAAVEYNVLALAGRLLTEYRSICNEANLPKLNIHMVRVYAAQVSRLANRQLQAAVNIDGDARQRILTQVSNYYGALTRLFENEEVLDFIPTMPHASQVELYNWQARALKESSDFHREHGDAALAAKLEVESFEILKYQTAKCTEITSMHFVFIEYLDKCIERSPAATHFVEQFVHTVLFGMSMADKSCSGYFPRLLGLVKEHIVLLPMLKEKLKTVPLWTCLHWSAQIMALIEEHSSPFGDFILTLLQQMATEYPRALYYDYRQSRESIPDVESNVRFHRLSALLTDAQLDQFVAALQGLHHPEIRFKEALRYLTEVVDTKSPGEASKIIATTMSKLLDESTTILGQRIGSYNRQWLQKNRKQIETMLGTQGQLTSKATLQTAKGWLSQSFQVMPGKYGIDRQWKSNLSDFSDWLVQLDPVNFRIELPGQYTKRWAKPDPSTHTYILSCDPQLMVLPSKQLPKRIAFHASDEKTYLFLVKVWIIHIGGEDLRLDQRIEQLFDVMNSILQQNAHCTQRHLMTRTYKVIPMTQTIGLVEWLQNTTTLKTIVEEEMTVKKKVNLLQTAPGQLYEGLWAKQRGKTYGQKIACAPEASVAQTLSDAHALLSPDFLRRRLVSMGKTTEAFFKLRETFEASLASFNGCAYVLGIGDRHLDNFLLDQTSGAVVGIDFGISFGSGASMLPVPELVPFRFTRQLQGVMQPYNAKLLFQQDLAAVLDALRGQQQRIDSVMRVFLNEPLLEWQVPVKKTQKGEHESASTMWMPQLKMDLARRKLRGEHVVHILHDELQLNAHVAPVLNRFHQILPAPSDILKHSVLSPVDQAKALIDVATNPNVLGRMFHGWSPWA
ncbi:Aste57867_25263 [Aphanomyces stellatus]|uniref:Aste57867_25263 protein n=1 Tax=Aphanomyces stellatus TaxID=120398 RepID=A0A485LSM5_9STRA|nr:hypothetical protein As57867_025185 [Aphanomyces stellatus]VFU01889.1 Aste57867_25263 [Aphanomyces stellatus]